MLILLLDPKSKGEDKLTLITLQYNLDIPILKTYKEAINNPKYSQFQRDII